MPLGQETIRVFWDLEHPIASVLAIRGEGGREMFILFNLTNRNLSQT